MKGLVIADSIPIQTSHGECAIELCLGSVTKLTEPVHILVVSAFPGDYSATPTSVIGALRRDLNINFRDLARDKEEDLRKLCSCWWSKPLKKGLPFNRILCFEGGFKKNSRPPTTISEVFRSLNTLGGKEDVKVIMPLLAAGDQGYDKELMLRLIVEATIHWMVSGLPLKLLKLVLYTERPEEPTAELSSLVKYFAKLKQSWLHVSEKESFSDIKRSFDYDVYISCSVKDQKIGDMLKDVLYKQNPTLRIFYNKQEIDPANAWQEHMYQVIVASARVFTLLSPQFLEEPSCIEQYNLALCCTRYNNHNYLVPLYIEEIQQIPTYIGLIQYIECRPISADRIMCACETLFPCTNDEIDGKKPQETRLLKTESILLDPLYDIFISYSHKETEMAVRIVNLLRIYRPELNIFIDQSGLNAGSAWQLKLYQSIERSRAVVALISMNYFESKVCQEEYNLARALHEDPSYRTILIQIKTSNINTWPTWCSPTCSINMVSTDGHDINQKMKHIAQMVDVQETRESSIPTKGVAYIKQITSKWRQEFRRQGFPFTTSMNILEKTDAKEYSSSTKYDIILSYHGDDISSVNLLCKYLRRLAPNLKIGSRVNNRTIWLHELDKGKLIVPLISSNYLNSQEHVEELHIALCRHRASQELVIFPIFLEELPLSPAYPQILLCFFCVEDNCWLDEGEPLPACLKTFAQVIVNVLCKNIKISTSFKTLMSMRELEEWSVFKSRQNKTEKCDLFPWLFSESVSDHIVPT